MMRSWLVPLSAVGLLSLVACGSSSSGDSSTGGGGATGTGGGTGDGGTSAAGGASPGAGGSQASAGSQATGGSASGDTTVVAHATAGPSDVAVDATSIYWTQSGGGVVQKVPLAGGAPQVIVPMANGARSIAVDDTGIYWLGANGTLNTAGLDGSNPKVIFTSTDELGTGLAVHGGLVFFAIHGAASGVSQVPVAGAATAQAVGIAPAGQSAQNLVGSNATGVFYTVLNTGGLSTDIWYATYDGATSSPIAAVPLSGAGSGTLRGVGGDDDNAYYIVQPTASGPYPVFAAPITGAGTKQLFTYSGAANNPVAAPGGKLLFTDSASSTSGVYEADATGTVTEFYTPPDLGSGSNGHRLLRLTPDKSALVWVTGVDDNSPATFHKKAL